MKNYPTDEELNAFLEKLEQQELYAPEHLKEEIMKKVFPSELPRTEEKNDGSLCRICPEDGSRHGGSAYPSDRQSFPGWQ